MDTRHQPGEERRRRGRSDILFRQSTFQLVLRQRRRRPLLSPAMILSRSVLLCARGVSKNTLISRRIYPSTFPKLASLPGATAEPWRSFRWAAVSRSPQIPEQQPAKPKLTERLRENIYTYPNLLTVSRILACPVLGWAIVQDNFVLATSLLAYAGLTDLVRTPEA